MSYNCSPNSPVEEKLILMGEGNDVLNVFIVIFHQNFNRGQLLPCGKCSMHQIIDFFAAGYSRSKNIVFFIYATCLRWYECWMIYFKVSTEWILIQTIVEKMEELLSNSLVWTELNSDLLSYYLGRWKNWMIGLFLIKNCLKSKLCKMKKFWLSK